MAKKTRMPETPRITTIPGVTKMTKTTQMTDSKNRKGLRAWPMLAVTAGILAVSFGAAMAPTAAVAQDAAVAQTAVVAQEDARAAREELRYAYALAPGGWSTGAESAQVPQDIRIMQRIVHTALGEVEAPELPDALNESGESSDMPGAYVYDAGGSRGTLGTLWLADTGGRGYSIGGRDVLCEGRRSVLGAERAGGACAARRRDQRRGRSARGRRGGTGARAGTRQARGAAGGLGAVVCRVPRFARRGAS